MFVTVALCTFNRAASLRRTLDSLLALVVPDDVAWELVIVNNNSSDHTDDVIGAYAGRLPVRREFEPKQGKSNALNRAIDVARGDYIVWIDDDVVVDPGLLTGYARAFRRWPEAAVFGGRIIPRYQVPVEKWVKDSQALLGGPYAIRDFGAEALKLSAGDENHFPYGANWAIRTSEQRAFRYDRELGPIPNRIRNQEETELISQLLAAGATGYWIPDATVEHCIGRERQTLRYIANYYESWGETLAFRSADAIAATPFWFGIPRRLWPRLFGWWALYRVGRCVSPARVWIKYLEAYSWSKGAYRYWREQRL